MSTIIVVFVFLALAVIIASERPLATPAPKIKEILASNITSNLKDWEKDLAVVFYAPWCKYCKQLMPSWEAIAGLMIPSKDLAVTKLNCEAPADNVALCKALNVDRYPTVMFFGYGNFNQGPKGNPVFGKPLYPQMVRYDADLYPEAIYDWVQFLVGVSGLKRKADDIVGFFTGKSRTARKLASLAKRTQEAERKAYLFGQELERYKAIEVFDTLEDYGDPFPLLNQLEPDDQNLPFRVCIVDMASEFCKYYPDDNYCIILNQCSRKDMEPVACRPAQCPFEDKRGCVVTSTCLKKEVISQYKDALRS